MWTVKNIDWRSVFSRIRNDAGYPAPGYLTHEAVQWSDVQQKWFFLPRKASTTVYNEKRDEQKAANILISGSADLLSFIVTNIGGPSNPDCGFSAFDFLPDSNDEIIVALRSKEIENQPAESYITIFDIFGEVYLDDQKLDGNYKFEGIYFV
ncbi:Apyrase [Oesophagostomum dentatum]|uniref:Apyrase n=1 Tax=Oesophagostomum dentatum TaxID=61180 RepID=A0A0B1TDI3_OESDE|nr:Apyrase [Oesophagostomum dentatum]